MKAEIQRHGVVSAFQCQGADCPDTCCKSWDMQLDAARLEIYQSEAPELLDAVMQGASGPVMRRDAATGYCVRLVEGWCSVHRQYGERFLGDACHFYPRVTRALGSEVMMTATMSCPEVARLGLFTDTPHAYAPAEADRLPAEIKDYAPQGLSGDAARDVHRACLAFVSDAPDAQAAMLGLISLARSLDNLELDSWEGAVPFILRTIEGRLLPPESHPQNPARLLLLLMTVLHAVSAPVSERLQVTLDQMARLLGVGIDRERVALTQSDQPGADLSAACARVPDALLRRWLQMHLAMNQFPFAGHGESPFQRVQLVAVKWALTRLALAASMAVTGGDVVEAEAIRAVQSVARVLDHVGNPALMLAVCEEFGWAEETALSGLIAS